MNARRPFPRRPFQGTRGLGGPSGVKHLAILASLVASGAACSSGASPAPARPPATTRPIAASAPVEPPPTPAALRARLSHVRFGWGSTGVVAPDAPPPEWAIGFADLEAHDAIDGLRLARVELYDANGTRVATGTAELELRVAPAGRSDNDFSSYGTTPLPARLAPGTRMRLWLHSRLDDAFAAPPVPTPTRYVAVLVTSTGVELRVEGPLDPPWATA